uniref:Conotoxin mr3c n=1 Tax=Conus marmoreus TaxID=42752 RepID=M3C_CONMR|nr:RecName: Full=Conotoxin mr3c [Conus marmoreus]
CCAPSACRLGCRPCCR